MTINDFRNIEFGACFQISGETFHYKIPVDNTVKEALVEMRNSFFESYDSISGEPDEFSVSEKYGSNEKLRINLNTDYLQSINDLFHRQNIPVNTVDVSANLPFTEYYFAEFNHNNGSKTICVKRPNSFKALLKKKMMRCIDDTLLAVEDDIFKLDNDFDFVIHDTYVEILHPAGFIFVSNLEGQVLNGVPNTIATLMQAMPYVNFEAIGDYILRKKLRNAARLLTSIKSRADIHLTCQERLSIKCATQNISVTVDENGKLITNESDIIAFLEILDRRLYDYDLVEGQPENYVASRRKIKR